MSACILIIAFLFELLSTAFGSDNTRFANITGISGKVCPSSDIVSSVSAPSLISCVYYCTTFETCRGVFYNDEDLSCIGCQGYYSDPSELDDKPGTVYFSSPLPTCQGPLPNVANVNVSQFNGDRKMGASFPYTCDAECTLFPRPWNSVIVCKEDETWSTPQCLDTRSGYFSNGNSIPSGAQGCVSEYYYVHTNDCEVADGYFLNGSIGVCSCSPTCCDSADCCYDVDYYHDYRYYYFIRYPC